MARDPDTICSLFGTTSSIWRVDETDSIARFAAATLWGRAPVRGRLGKAAGMLEWDGAAGHGQLTITTSKLSSGNRLRDHHLRGRDFFAIAEHPEVEFVATEFVVDRGDVHMQGELVVRGNRCKFGCAAAATRLDADRIALDATVTLDLEELGMSRGFLRMIPPEVTADVRVVLQRAIASTLT
jgi:polyisoprenoid-binding protein YceI